MPIILPAVPLGERFFSVNIGDNTFVFRTYYVSGQESHWLLDIFDSQNQPLIAGINLISGVDNVLKGRGDILQGYQLSVVSKDDQGKKEEALGNTLMLIWFTRQEENPFTPQDPMETIGTDLLPW